MPIPTLTGLQTALSALDAAQAALDTSGQNIANADTPGYTREVVNQSASTPLTITSDGNGLQLGTGVDMTSITRVRNQFLDVSYRAQNGTEGYASTMANELNQVQQSFNEPSSTGLASQLDNFWGSWNDLANAPSSGASQTTVVATGTSLAQSFNLLSGQLSTIQSQATQQLATLTGSNGQVQDDATEIAKLNGQISQAMAAGQDPNTLEDQRDNALDDLSSLGQVSIVDPGNGLLQVSFAGAAQPLVSGTTVSWPQTIGANPGGQLGALQSLSSATGPIGQYLSQLDTVAGQVISSVNALQPTTPFFSGTGAANIAVVATPSTVQASSTPVSGGNDLALKIAGLQGGTADQGYASLVQVVGNAAQTSQTNQTNAQGLLTAISNQRQSVSSVSLDEEMTNLVSYQSAYEAASRTMTTLDSMLNTLINQTGVGS